MPYLLDANVFIEAKNRYYDFDVCPAFWDWLVRENAAGKVFSIEAVGDELAAGNDALSAWAKARGSSFFLPLDAAVLSVLPRVAAWPQGRSYHPSAITTFLQSADYFLISHALAHNHVVVTHEAGSSGPKRVKIPEPCIGLGSSRSRPS